MSLSSSHACAACEITKHHRAIRFRKDAKQLPSNLYGSNTPLMQKKKAADFSTASF
jgi:hypothetical protein